MKNIKKITSFIISVLLIFTSLVVPEFAAKANTTDTNDKEVYNSSLSSATCSQFPNTDGKTNAKLRNDALEGTHVTESNDAVLKLTGNGTTSDVSRTWQFSATEDWSSYNYLNFRIRNTSTDAGGDATDGTFIFKIFPTAGNWTKTDGHTVTGNEWQTLSVKIPNDFTPSNGVVDKTAMNNIAGLQFINIAGTMWLERIWLSTENPNGTDDSNPSSGEDNTGGDDNSTSSGGDNTGDDTTSIPGELFNSNSSSSTKDKFTKATYATLSSESVESNDKSLKLTGSQALSHNSNTLALTGSKDWTSYNYLNFRIRNAGSSEDGIFRFKMFTSSTEYWCRNTGHKITENEWHTFSVKIPDDVTHSANNATSMDNILGLQFDYITGTMYLEKIWLSETKPETTKYIASSVPDGYDDVKVDSAAVTFTYSQNLAPDNKQNAEISFTTDGEDVAFDASYSENKLTIVPKNTLEYNTSYSIAVSGLKDYNGFGITGKTEMSFTTMEKGVSVSKPTLCNGSGVSLAQMPASGKIVASVEADNLTADSAGVALVLACYDTDGKMIMDETDIKSVSLAPSETKPITAEISSSDYSGKTVCAFVIDNINARNLLTPDYAFLPVTSSGEAGSVLPGATDMLTLKYFDFADDTVSFDATLNGGMKRTVLMSIMSGDIVIHMSPLNSTSDGNVSASYKMTDSDASGKYTLELKGRKIKNSLTKNFTHLDQRDKAIFFDAAQSLSSVDAAVAFIRSYSDVFGFEDSLADDNTLMHMTAEALLYNKPYSDFEDVKSFVKDAVSICKKLNSQSWDTLANYVINNENILIGEYDISDFKALSETNRNKVCNSIKPLTFTSLKDLYNKLTNATKAYKDSLTSNPTSSKPSNSSGGGYSVSTPAVVAPQVTPTEPAPDYSFNDLAGYSWATESIQNLLDAGVISKPTDNKYRPYDMVTRSEFVKLLVCALYDINEPASSEFADVNDDDWCYTYIAIAAKYGLINGRGDGNFGKNDYITRQEMATIIYRAILDRNMSLPSGLSEYAYTDDATISDYAKDAVYALYHTGIMSGVGDGNFAATQNADRAQAACVIDRIMKGANK